MRVYEVSGFRMTKNKDWNMVRVGDVVTIDVELNPNLIEDENGFPDIDYIESNARIVAESDWFEVISFSPKNSMKHAKKCSVTGEAKNN